MKKMTILALSVIITVSTGCKKREADLQHQLYQIINDVPGTVGVAFVSDHDTVTVNNGVHFPMMSVFKFHQALATAYRLDSLGHSVDSILNITRSELDSNTWSPMLKKYGCEDFSISVRELINYAITVSDNNASNILFNHIISPQETDTFIKSIAPDETFNISYSEAEMKQNPAISYANYTSPLSAALLIGNVFKSEIVDNESQMLIKEALASVTTGQDRLGAALPSDGSVFFAHKTGSGYRNAAGELTAHNDVGYFYFPDGSNYTLAIFIRDFNGTETEASEVIEHISRIIYNYFTANEIQ